MAPARPMNRDEYLDSLRDGREVWIHGEKVDDVTAHPAFRNSARSVARLYDALHDPARVVPDQRRGEDSEGQDDLPVVVAARKGRAARFAPLPAAPPTGR